MIKKNRRITARGALSEKLLTSTADYCGDNIRRRSSRGTAARMTVYIV